MNKKHVLIIDDDKDIANLFSVVLSMVGFDCDIIHTAKEAFAWLATSVPDIILLDMRLGFEVGGEDILYQIRSNPRFTDTEVIVITAYPQMASLVTSLADQIMLKPVDIDQLKSLASRIGIKERKSPEEYFTDPVTAVYNEAFFYTRLKHALERSKRRPDFIYAVCVLQFELEPHKYSSLPDEHANALLCQIAGRLKQNLRPTDTISRLSGNEFATLHEDLTNPEDGEIIIRRMREFLSQTYTIHHQDYRLRLKFGIALNDTRFQEPEAILETAKVSLEFARTD